MKKYKYKVGWSEGSNFSWVSKILLVNLMRILKMVVLQNNKIFEEKAIKDCTQFYPLALKQQSAAPTSSFPKL